MRLETKAQISKATLSLLTAVTALFVLGILVLVVCAGLQINPFRETTTSFLVAAFAGLAGVAAVLVLLNVATNVSLIADAKIVELNIDSRGGVTKRWSAAFLVVAAAIVCFILVGTYLSKERYLGVVRSQADEVLRANSSLLEETSRLLASGRPEDYKRIVEIRSFLQSQRSDLPQLTIIYSGKFTDKLAFYKVEYYDWNQPKDTYVRTYFECTKDLDCDYLTRFFSGERVDVLQKYTMRNDQFYIYIPYTGSAQRFVLFFDRRNSYGKVGS